MPKLRITLDRINQAFWVFGLLGLFLFFLFLFKNRFPMFDTDLWYHQAISRMTIHHGLIRTLPQAEDLNWARAFPEKEFLFHVLTSIGYFFAGDLGVEWSVHLVAFLCLLSLSFVSNSLVSRGKAFVIVIAMTLSVPYFSMRMMLARPHVLAMFYFIFILWGLLRNSRTKIFFGSLCFALAYHTFHIPLAIFGIWIGIGFFSKWKLKPGIVFWGIFGLVLGIVLNPYFPSNIKSSVDVLKIALQARNNLAGMASGGELAPIGWRDFFIYLWPQVLSMIFVLWVWWKKPEKLDESGLKLIGFWLMSLLFLFISEFNQRGTEYWIPLLVITLSLSISYSEFKLRLQKSFLILLLLMPVYFLINEIRTPPNLVLSTGMADVVEAIAKIPFDERGIGKKVVNTNFGIGEVLLYQREDLRFVDLLDPLLLYYSDPEKFEALRTLKLGITTNPYDVLRKVFKADFVISDYDPLSNQLAKDLHFREMGRKDSLIRIFQLI